MSSRKVIACKTVPLSLLLNTALSWSSQQSLVQLAVGSTPVSSQNALTMGETATSRAFPFGHCHRRLRTASPTLCKVREYTSNHSVLSTSPRTSSRIMNCPMFRMVGVGRQMSRPCTLRLHCQTARRHLASERATPSAPSINGAMHSYQGTSLSKMPWTANCNQCVVHQVGSTVSRVFLFADVQAVYGPLPQASSGAFKPSPSRGSTAAVPPLPYVADRCMLSLEIIFQHLVLIK